jgi:cobalt-zinc-cadmium efflux system membrane fusion protein
MMKAGIFVLLISSFSLVTACSSGPANTAAAEHAAPSNSPAIGKDEIALPASVQGAGNIQTQAAALSEEPDTLRVAGRITLADDRMWRVGVLTEGRVEIVYAGLGDHVEKGQVLARMHSHALHDARAQYQTSRTDVNRLQAAAALAQKNYDRMQTLLGLKAASIQQTEQARQDMLNAQTALRDGQIAADRDRIHLEENLGVAADPPAGVHDENSDLLPIVAPGSGYILDKMVTPGSTVQPSTDTFVIGELSQVWMLASVHQENLGALRVGQSATVTLPGVPGKRFPGKITNLGQALDATTRVMKVRITLNNPGNLLKPEMLANAELPIGNNKPTLVVPSDAVQQFNGQDVVFVRTAAERFAIRPVSVGGTTGGRTPVLEGLKAGEQVVVKGSFILKSQFLKSSMED